MTPKEYKQMMDYLTRSSIKDKVKFASDIARPDPKPIVEEIELFNEFNKRNPMAGGGMLVQPGFGGTRQGYAKEKPKDPRNTGVGKGSPGIPKDYEPKRDQLYTPEVRAKISETRKKQFLESPLGKRLKWIADNGKNYDSPLKMKKAYEKHFKHTLGTEADALFYTVKGGKNVSVTLGKKGLEVLNKRIPLDRVDNLTNPGKAKSSVFAFTKEFSEDEIFKASIIQNNPKVRNKFIDLFADINENVGTYSVELGPEEMVLKLRSKGGYLLDSYEKGGFDFLFSYPRPGDPMQTIGGVHKGITRNTLLKAGVPEKHIQSFQLVRKPLESIEKILNKVSTNPNYAKKVWGVGAGTSKKIASQLNNFMEGQATAKKIVRDLDNIFIKGQMSKEGYTGTVDSYLKTDAGKTASNNFSKVFGGTQFDHTLAKSIGRDYKYLPRNYLLKGQFTTGKFNRIKKDVFDLPLIELLKGYEKKKVSGAEIKNFIDDFNKKTGGYADFTFDEKTGKIVYPQEKKVIYDLSRYSNPEVVRQELEKNIRLTTSSKFQKNFKEAISKENLKLFKSQEAKNILNQIAVLGGGDCGRIRKYQGGRIGLQDGTPNVDVCFKNATNRINSGFKNATPAEARNYTKLLNAVKGSAVIGKNLLKIGIVPEALYVGADALVRMGYGDTFKEAGLRASDFFIPGDQMQEADKLKVQRTLGDAAATNVGRVFDYRNQINKIKSLESQRESLEALNVPSEFGYTGDLTPQVKNIDMSLNQAKNDLQNKFMVSEAETVAADQALEEAYDASMAKGRFAKTLKTLRDIEPVQDDPFLSDIATPEKTQMELNLKMFPPMQTDFMKMTDTDIINRRRQLIDEGYDLPSSRQLMADRDKEIADMKARSLLSFPREQVFGTQGTFFGQPLAGGGIAKIAGVDQGPPPESGPNSQGLQGLMKSVRNR